MDELLNLQEEILELGLSCSHQKLFNAAMISVLTLSIHENIEKCDREEFLREICNGIWKSFNTLDREEEKSGCF